MIKLSEVKVRLQYRWRVRQRLIHGAVRFLIVSGSPATVLAIGTS